VDLRLERVRVSVVPRLGRDVAAVDEHVLSAPVVRLARQPVAALEQQDALPRWRQTVYQRATAGTAADHDHIVCVGHPHCPRSIDIAFLRVMNRDRIVTVRCNGAIIRRG